MAVRCSDGFGELHLLEKSSFRKERVECVVSESRESLPHPNGKLLWGVEDGAAVRVDANRRSMLNQFMKRKELPIKPSDRTHLTVAVGVVELCKFSCADGVHCTAGREKSPNH